MSEPARNRFALDLDDLERQLRGAAQPQRPGGASDPLQELTRIVGQEDPLRDIFAPRPQPAQAAPQHAENVTHLSAVRAQAQQAPAEEAEAPAADLRGAMDEFEQLLVKRGGGRQDRADAEPEARDLDDSPETAVHGGAYAPQESYPDLPMTAGEELAAFEPRRSRKGLWVAGAFVGVVAIGAVSALAFRETVTRPSGEPPLITVAEGPVKVEPANPGGAEIPNQNKQIYERAGDTPPTKAKVVSSEEQPLDVEQNARLAQPRVVLPGPGTGPVANPAGAATPTASPIAATNPNGLVPVPAVPGLGEPRRVRTVAIRPDGTPANQPLAETAPHVATTASAPARPVSAEPRQRIAAASPPARPAEPQASATPAAAPTPAAPVRTASLPPAQPAAQAPRSGGEGGFAVQLAAPGSEAEARATFSALQRKYPGQLSGQTPIVRRTELAGGKTVYRLRVGPYSREDAATVCTQLQAAGGQCFIAKN